MNNYELLYLVSNQFTDNEAGKIKEKVDELVKKNGGAIGHQDFLGKRKLAYPIQKAAHGYYFASEFELEDVAGLKALNNNLKLDKEVLRYQIIAKPKITPEEIARQERQKRREKMEGQTQPERARPEKPGVKKTARPKAESKKVSIENLDEKLDELLKDEVI